MLNAKDYGGNTPLHLAAEFTDLDHAKIVLYLLFMGALPDIKNNAGQTAEDLIRASREQADDPNVILALQQAIEFIDARKATQDMLNSLEDAA